MIASDNDTYMHMTPDYQEEHDEYPSRSLEAGEEQDSNDDGDVDIYQLGNMAAYA